MNDDVVRIPLERQMRPLPSHPQIKRVVQKQIGQQWANDSPLRGAAVTLLQVSFFILRWYFQPTFNVEFDPLLFRVLPHRAHHQIVIEIVEGRHDTLPTSGSCRITSKSHGTNTHSKVNRWPSLATLIVKDDCI